MKLKERGRAEVDNQPKLEVEVLLEHRWHHAVPTHCCFARNTVSFDYKSHVLHPLCCDSSLLRQSYLAVEEVSDAATCCSSATHIEKADEPISAKTPCLLLKLQTFEFYHLTPNSIVQKLRIFHTKFITVAPWDHLGQLANNSRYHQRWPRPE